MSMQSLLAKREDDDTAPGAPEAASTAQLECPTGSTPDIRLPDYRLNCNIFQPQQINGPAGGFSTAFGICTGVQAFMRRRTLANSQYPLTWDNEGKRSTARRNRACGSAYCTATQNNLANLAGLNAGVIQLSCDEFPFASTEEGGDYLTTLRSNPTFAQKTCVPAWQNSLQGNCNQLLNQIYTNVGYFERSIRGDQAENWAKWGSPNGATNWLTAGSLGDGGGQPQRKARYPDQQPKPDGIDDANTLGWNYKRNFTHGLAQPQGPTDGAAWGSGTNGAQSWAHVSPKPQVGNGFSGTNLEQIACAVNIFGQDEVFKQDYNGLCFNGRETGGRGFDRQPSTSSCRIEFSQPGNTKRSIGQSNGWEVTSKKSNVSMEIDN
ncbi:MAG: hypothetical protein Q9221_002412 [Calogaya cf. arnoldii]